MNILLLSTHLDTGGITSYLLSLSKALRARGNAVFIASSGGNQVTRFTEQGIIFIPIPIRTKSEINPFKILPSCAILERQVREKSIEIIHANTRVTQALAALVSRRTKVPFVSTCHGFFRPHFFRRLFPFRGEKTIAISDPVRQHLRDEFHFPEENIRLVYSGVDTQGLRLLIPKNRQEVREKLAGLSSGPVVGIVARLSDVKGHVFLIRAFKTVLSRHPEAQLLLVGEGRMEKKLRLEAKELDIESKVFFLPKVSDVRDVYYVIDVFVMPSLREGLGLGLMEAMAWGKPVVASSVGGIVNLVKDGKNGLLVKPADSDGLARAIIRLLDAPDQAATYGHNARSFIVQNFSLEKMAEGTERVYEECLNPRA